jgi:hypothetical protein
LVGFGLGEGFIGYLVGQLKEELGALALVADNA